MSLKLKVLSPEGSLLDVSTDSVRLPAIDGSLGVMPGHQPMLLALTAGEVIYRAGSDTKRLAIPGGLAQVDGQSITVLADAQ